MAIKNNELEVFNSIKQSITGRYIAHKVHQIEANAERVKRKFNEMRKSINVEKRNMMSMFEDKLKVILKQKLETFLQLLTSELGSFLT